VPLTHATRGLFDAGLLARMRDGALLVNAARGAVVDQDALLAELRAGRLRAALDVVDPEPLPAGHPLWEAPGLLLTPHVAGGTRGHVQRGFAHLRAQLQRLADGRPLADVVRDGY
jgi:phosphoglycerate dehydrogenase-like enzyme